MPLIRWIAPYEKRIAEITEAGHGYAAGGPVGWEFVGEHGPEMVSINDFADPHHAVISLRQVEAWSVANRAAITEDCHDCEVHAWFGGIVRVVTRFCDRHQPKETT